MSSDMMLLFKILSTKHYRNSRRWTRAGSGPQSNQAKSPEIHAIPHSEIEAEIEKIKNDMLQVLRQKHMDYQHHRTLQDRIQTLSETTDHPDLGPVIIASHHFLSHGRPERLGFGYLSRNQYPQAYLLMARKLNFWRAFSHDTYRGFAALQDPRTIPELLPYLPHIKTFHPAMRLLESHEWTPSTDEEKAFQLIYRYSLEPLDTHRDSIHTFLESQLNSTEVRRRVFASQIIIDQNRTELFPK